ncbi:hypothetical protein BCR33DRAFT_845647 [Rhizoclosmatium globosum]|uniref:Uncharacterized protein n=1 Tax=Rhizoclosmatium globosum TaxID=329046 RepID=A0A1Y2CZX5_9FUNG|nr:hypothetical protein BCR33DRAFT_845647 [Rhizoclosmatium globosum]|eukprot:ORY52507.1 hypothetical protein BCR33DRAFT_845647 [Rhizoclosmatium globosum]
MLGKQETMIQNDASTAMESEIPLVNSENATATPKQSPRSSQPALSKDEYLSAARAISQERVRKVLFIDCEDEDLSVPPTPRLHRAPLSSNISAMDTAKDPLFIATSLTGDTTTEIHLPTKLITSSSSFRKTVSANTTFSRKISSFSQTSLSYERVRELNENMDAVGICEALRGCDVHKDAPEIACMILDVLRTRKPVFAQKFHSALKGILAVNNTSGTRLPGATVPVPAESTMKLIRSVFIMIESESRQILHYTLDFLRRICECSKAKANITTTARELSKIFGPILVGLGTGSVLATPVRTSSIVWAETLCELLLYAHGLPTNEASALPVTEDGRKILVRNKKQSLLWKVPIALQDSINERVNLLKTPSRRSVMSVNVTPRRQMAPISRVAGMGGVSNVQGNGRRTLFGSPKPASKSIPDSFNSPNQSRIGANSPTKFLFSSSSAPHFNSNAGSVYAFGNGISGSDSGAVFLSSVNLMASSDRNSFAKRLKIE